MANDDELFWAHVARLNEGLQKNKGEIAQLTTDIDKTGKALDILVARKDNAERTQEQMRESLSNCFKQRGALQSEESEMTGTPATAPTVERNEVPANSTNASNGATRDNLDPKKKSSLPETLNNHYSTIIKIDGVWTEIKCIYCGANAVVNRPEYFRGVQGLALHLSHAHKEVPRRSDYLNHCSKRQVSAEDVVLMSSTPPMPPKDVPVEQCRGSERCKTCSLHKPEETTTTTARKTSAVEHTQASTSRKRANTDPIQDTERFPERRAFQDTRSLGMQAIAAPSTQQAAGVKPSRPTDFPRVPGFAPSDSHSTATHQTNPQAGVTGNVPSRRNTPNVFQRFSNPDPSNATELIDIAGETSDDGSHTSKRSALE